MTDPSAVWDVLAGSGGMWAWGDEDGVAPWTAADGSDVVPLWTSAQRAGQESQAGAEPGEGPVFLDVEALLEAIPEWLAAGAGAAGLESEDGRFLRTVPLVDLTERLLRLHVDRQP